jgi:DNA-binding transcriptional MerR regulator
MTSVDSNDSQGMANDDPSLSIDDAAAHYGVSARTIRRYIKDRKLAAFKRTTERGFEWRVYAGQDVANDADKDRHATATIDSNDRQPVSSAGQSIIEVVPAASQIDRLLDTIEDLQEAHRQEVERIERENKRLSEAAEFWQGRALNLEAEVKLLMAPKDEPAEEQPAAPEPKRSWWQRLIGG